MAGIKYSLGLDYGTNSVRGLLVKVSDGSEVATSVFNYLHGDAGIILDEKNPDLARQHPLDYLAGAKTVVREVLEEAKKRIKDFDSAQIIGIGVDTTGSTPLPVDKAGVALAMKPEFEANPNAMAWLWKDHTGHAEAAQITSLAKEKHPEYLAKCGGTYSSEWFFSKVWHCLKVDPEVFDAAYSWVEIADWIPAVLVGNTKPTAIKRGVCSAGHKAMYNPKWGGLPCKEFLATLDPKLGNLRECLYDVAYTSDQSAGSLCQEWAERLGLPAGIPVAVGAFDAHLGAVGSGIKPGALVKIIGTSTCDMMIAPNTLPLADVPGLCGIVDGSIVPGYFGLEAGQSAVGDIFNWFVSLFGEFGSHETLTEGAGRLRPGESGLLALDWNNGNRTVLVDQRLTGLLLGQTLQTRPEEIYRALIEATAFGALVIINRFEEYGIKVDQVVNCGGIAEKNPLVMQIYADVLGRPMKVSRSSQTCALGAAIAGAVVAGSKAGGHDRFEQAQATMTGLKEKVYAPDPSAHSVYQELFALYQQLHDAFGAHNWQGNLFGVMKTLLEIRDRVRG